MSIINKVNECEFLKINRKLYCTKVIQLTDFVLTVLDQINLTK